jgi:hypothetical protein
LRLWPNKMADGNTRSTTPGLLSDLRENELDESGGTLKNEINDNLNNESNNKNINDEFPMLDELDRLAKVFFSHFQA